MVAQTKGAIVLRALRRAGLASTSVLLPPEPESIQDALVDLEDMMAEWEGNGLIVRYRYTGNAQGLPQPDELSGLPDWAVAPVAHNLALRALIDNQRPVPDELATLAYNGKVQIEARIVEVPMLQRRNDMPRGSGAGQAWRPFGENRFYHEKDRLSDSDGTDIEL